MAESPVELLADDFVEDHDAPEGYRSAAERNTHIAGVVVASIVYGMLQFIVPYALMFTFFLNGRFPGVMTMPVIMNATQLDARLATVWNDQTWIVSGNYGQPPFQLSAWDAAGKPVAGVRHALPLAATALVPDGTERLWVLHDKALTVIEPAGVRTVYPRHAFRELQGAFLHQGRLAAFDKPILNGPWQYLELDGVEWTPVGWLEPPPDEFTTTRSAPPPGVMPYSQTSPLQVVIDPGDGTPVFVFRRETTLWFTRDWPIVPDQPGAPAVLPAADGPVSAESARANGSGESVRWTRLCDTAYDQWSVCFQGGELCVVTQRASVGNNLLQTKFLVERWDGERLGRPVETTVDEYVQSSAIMPGPNGTQRLLTPKLNGYTLVADRYDGETLVREPFEFQVDATTTTTTSPITIEQPSWKFQVGNAVILYGMLAIYLATIHRLTQRFRTRRFAFGHLRVELASLLRRGLARFVDGLLVTIPLAPVWIWFLVSFDQQAWIQDFSRNPTVRFPELLGAVLGLLLYGIFTTVLFGVWEGRWGWSPGKGLCGLRVVRTTLEPIGVPRGMIRQILLLGDTFFTYVVGVALIAITGKQQRLGDIAADSIVIVARELPDYRQRSP
jgi:uncharacterized RDD family membrane protein YckC